MRMLVLSSAKSEGSCPDPGSRPEPWHDFGDERVPSAHGPSRSERKLASILAVAGSST
jgi:hypothetical protein